MCACASRRVRMPRCTRTCACAAPSALVCSPYPRACAYGWIHMHACIDGSASTGVHRYACICVCVERCLYHYYTSIMHLYACLMYGRIAALCTQVSMSVCTQTDRYRWGALVSRAIASAKDIMCMDIRLYLDTCTSERRRGARVRVRLRRVRARVLPRGVTSASGCNRRSERVGVPITRMRVRV